MAKLNPIGFSKRTFASTSKIHVDKQIMDAIESRGYLRKEIARVFQQANRRIQNVEKTGLVSPAVVALNTWMQRSSDAAAGAGLDRAAG